MEFKDVQVRSWKYHPKAYFHQDEEVPIIWIDAEK